MGLRIAGDWQLRGGYGRPGSKAIRRQLLNVIRIGKILDRESSMRAVGYVLSLLRNELQTNRRTWAPNHFSQACLAVRNIRCRLLVSRICHVYVRMMEGQVWSFSAGLSGWFCVYGRAHPTRGYETASSDERIFLLSSACLLGLASRWFLQERSRIMWARAVCKCLSEGGITAMDHGSSVIIGGSVLIGKVTRLTRNTNQPFICYTN